ncbi:hypothetical protein EO41_004144 [Escherichia coli]|nr:hypothetical protein [Escherichia coli]EFL9717763.1 hypothetical protein [Escherichia coli]EFL9748931.1 hypothetical protein [Escherichia coli]EGI4495957.1 hypothetical protein [Escherichia coli]
MATTKPSNAVFFLSCLYGSELAPLASCSLLYFLSCLYGSEQDGGHGVALHAFLSCLYGSELKYYTFSPLLIKQNHLNLLLPPFFILTYPQH